ncbi:uncharacterized protein [Rutidosis leptorrhynchoides]|uniref:uncharacterized protein n=1 Tax=Rutidosis leptorrhynchoides TaxID=125765 RepID=UPI003A9A5DD1
MLPHSYTVDSLSQSQDLASTILSSSTQSQIAAACASIESFLHSHSPDQLRHFFSLTFPTLICKLFGFSDASPSSAASVAAAPTSKTNGWIDVIVQSNDAEFASRVFSLLAPDGLLLKAISAVDNQCLVKYVFPVERLPVWARLMLSVQNYARVLADFCPLFIGKVKEDSIKGSLYQVQLNVFEYYMFWFAYYPICKASGENTNSFLTKKDMKYKLENWTSSIIGLPSSINRKPEQKLECNLYMCLLYAYLKAFVPINDLNAHQPYRSSLLHYSSINDGSVIMRAEFLVNTLVHYWLVDNDFSPLPISSCKPLGVSNPLRSVLGEAPPTVGLGEVVKLFVKYLNLSTFSSSGLSESTVEYSNSPRWKVNGSPFEGLKSKDVAAVTSCVQSVGLWNGCIQRPLYRFILRAFLFCPLGSSIKNVSQVFSVWTAYLEPWAAISADFTELDEIVDRGKDLRKENQLQGSGYSNFWQGYVLSNYLYYSSLVMHFIGFAHKFLHTDPEVIVQMVLKIMTILSSSKELTELLRNMYTVFHLKQASTGKGTPGSLQRFVPSIQEQLQDWEDGLCESDADGSFLHDKWNKDLKLFDNGEDGGQQLLQLFILRAEAELQATSRNNLAQNLQCIDSLKAHVCCVFGGNTTLKPISISPEGGNQPQKSRDEIFKPRGVGNYKFADIKYKGDWMNRPVSDDEIACLVKLLILLSNWLNDILGLNRAPSPNVSPKWSYVEVSDGVDCVSGTSETLKAVLLAVGSWLLMLGASMVNFLRKRGVKVNLRVLASKKVMMVLLMFCVFAILNRMFRKLF